MLKGLDQIDWASLTHAYGSASDVPNLLRNLLSPENEVRSEAMFALYGNIWHQHTVYEATSHAVPFLIEIAASEGTPDRFEVVSYLGTLAEGTSYLDVHGDLLRQKPDDFESRRKEELGYVERTRAAVKKGEAVYLSALESEQQNLCCAAAYVLSRFTSDCKYWTLLSRRFDRAADDAPLRCGIANLLQKFSKDGTAASDWLRERLEQEQNIAVKIQLAGAVAFLEQKFTTNAEAILLEHLLSDEFVKPYFKLQPWDIGEPIFYIIEALCTSERGREALVARFNELLATGAPTAVLEHCRYVMKMQLGERLVAPLDFDPLQPLKLQ